MFFAPKRTQIFPSPQGASVAVAEFWTLKLEWRGDTGPQSEPTCGRIPQLHYSIWSNSSGLVYRPITKSWRAAGARNVPAGPALWARGEFPLCSFLWLGQHAKRCFQPGSTSHDTLKLMQRVFSHPEAISWHIRGDCCGFCFVYRLANEVFVCVSASAPGRNLQFIMLVLTLLHLQPKHKQRLHRNLMGG